MSLNGKHFLTLQIAFLAAFIAVVILIFQLIDARVDKVVNQTINLMSKISAVEARIYNIEQRQDQLYESIKNLEKEIKNDS